MSYFKPDFLLSVLAVFLGGGTVQLIIFLLRRKPELKQISSATESVQVNSALALVAKLQEDGAVYREATRKLEDKVDVMETKYIQAQKDFDLQMSDVNKKFSQQLRDAHDENIRLTTKIAQLQTELDILTRQTSELRRHLK